MFKYYMVFFAAVKTGDVMQWSSTPVGVFKATTAEKACQAAAKKTGWMGNYFALEGFPWGVELFDTEEAAEWGDDETKNMTKLQQMEARSRELEVETGIATDEPIAKLMAGPH